MRPQEKVISYEKTIDSLLAFLDHETQLWKKMDTNQALDMLKQKESLTHTYKKLTEEFTRSPETSQSYKPYFTEALKTKVETLTEKSLENERAIDAAIKVQKMYIGMVRKTLESAQKPQAKTYTRQGMNTAPMKKRLNISLSLNAQL